MATTQPTSVEVLIIGAGMSGLCMAAMLRKAGKTSFVLHERSKEVGGTWLENHYPNSGCDVPSYMYSFSFAPKHDWSHKYARQPEILAYFRDVCDTLKIRDHIRFEQTVVLAEYSESARLWRITTSSGSRYEARYLISAVGQLSSPAIPTIEGASTFTGRSWHSAQWPADVDVTGKRVAVVGNGASTIQFLPEVVSKASHVTLCQRHASWIHPLNNPRYSPRTHAMFQRFPALQKLYRGWLFLACEYRIIALWDKGIAHIIYRWWLERNMRSRVRKDMQPILIPDYPPGCKRILLSSDYLEVVQRPSVTVDSSGIERITPHGIVTNNGATSVDCIIYGTGFETGFMTRTPEVRGRDGICLHEAWRNFPATFFGLATPGFPNLFFLYGPNTNLGHNSIIYMVETQVNYLLKLIAMSEQRACRQIEIRQEAVNRFVRQSQKKLGKSVWGAECSSWYKRRDGSIPSNWHTSTLLYRWHLRKPHLRHWRIQ